MAACMLRRGEGGSRGILAQYILMESVVLKDGNPIEIVGWILVKALTALTAAGPTQRALNMSVYKI